MQGQTTSLKGKTESIFFFIYINFRTFFIWKPEVIRAIIHFKTIY